MDKEALQIVAKELAPLAFDANNQFDSLEERAVEEEQRFLDIINNQTP